LTPFKKGKVQTVWLIANAAKRDLTMAHDHIRRSKDPELMRLAVEVQSAIWKIDSTIEEAERMAGLEVTV
jgi:hypothetical protein